MTKRSISNTENEFSKRLVQLMKAKNISVRKASEIASVPLATIQGWRSGSSPSADFVAVKRLAGALGVSLTYLLTGEIDGTPTIEELFKADEILQGVYEVRLRKLTPKQ